MTFKSILFPGTSYTLTQSDDAEALTLAIDTVYHLPRARRENAIPAVARKFGVSEETLRDEFEGWYGR